MDDYTPHMPDELPQPFQQQISWCHQEKAKSLERIADLERRVERRNGQDITADLVALHRAIIEKMDELIAAYERLGH